MLLLSPRFTETAIEEQYVLVAWLKGAAAVNMQASGSVPQVLTPHIAVSVRR